MPPPVLVLDNDGVLVDSEPLSNETMAELLTELGVPTTPAQSVDRYLGRTLGEVRRLVAEQQQVVLPADFEDSYHRRLFARYEHGLRPVAGVVEALDALADLTRCVASSGSRAKIERSLRLTGLLDRFEPGLLFSGEEVPHGKPAPDLFLHVADALGVAPSDCVVVEDAPAGVAAARAAGATVVGYAGLTPARLLAEADVVITSMADLPGVVHDL